MRGRPRLTLASSFWHHLPAFARSLLWRAGIRGRSPSRHSTLVQTLASPAADVAAELAESVQLAASCLRACSDMKAGNNTPSERSSMERLLQSLMRCTEGVLHGSSRDALLEMLHRLDASRWVHS